MANKLTPPQDLQATRSGERGAALILALMVSLVLVFLGLGLLLQTSLGLQASGTDRWVTKALYGAEAGVLMQIEMIQMGVLSAPSQFVLEDDPSLPGLLKTQFTVDVITLCETEPDRPVEGFQEGYSHRYFHIRSEAERNVGGLAGLTRAAIELDIEAHPFDDDVFEPVGQCY